MRKGTRLRKVILVLASIVVLAVLVVIVSSRTIVIDGVRGPTEYRTTPLVALEVENDQIYFRNYSPWIVLYESGCAANRPEYYKETVGLFDSEDYQETYTRLDHPEDPRNTCLAQPRTAFLLPGMRISIDIFYPDVETYNEVWDLPKEVEPDLEEFFEEWGLDGSLIGPNSEEWLQATTVGLKHTFVGLSWMDTGYMALAPPESELGFSDPE